MNTQRIPTPINNNGGFTWNYRVVNLKSQNGGEDWYCLQEVYYDMNDKLTGYCNISIGSESWESLRVMWEMMEEGMKLPPLQEEDFK